MKYSVERPASSVISWSFFNDFSLRDFALIQLESLHTYRMYMIIFSLKWFVIDDLWPLISFL